MNFFSTYFFLKSEREKREELIKKNYKEDEDNEEFKNTIPPCKARLGEYFKQP